MQGGDAGPVRLTESQAHEAMAIVLAGHNLAHRRGETFTLSAPKLARLYGLPLDEAVRAADRLSGMIEARDAAERECLRALVDAQPRGGREGGGGRRGGTREGE